MDPITLGVIGVALYGWLKGRGSSVIPTSTTGVPTPTPAQIATTPATATAGNSILGTGGAGGTSPSAPLATNTGNAGQPLAVAPVATPVPAELVALLDNDTAMLMRTYAAAYPDDFQVWLNRYAANIVLRNDLYFQALTNPPPGGYQLTPQMGVSLGVASYKVAQALNGVAAGNYGDLFGVAASTAGNLPMVDPNLVSALQGLALGYRAFSAALTLSQVSEIAVANGVSIMDVTASMLEAGGMSGSLAAAPIASLAGVLMVAGLVIDIGFTIAGSAPDIQKAIDVALDVAAIVCCFIPVVGWVIAIVIELVKFIIDLFGSDLFGGGLSHTDREILETARYGQNINPMYPQLAAAYTPRELFNVCVQWGSGYCGGVHVVAMGINLVLKQGDTLQVGGRPYTVASDQLLPIVQQPCYSLQGTPFAAITNDELAWALGMYGSTNGTVANAQAGIAQWRQTQFDDPTVNLIKVRTTPMRNMLAHGFTLDQCDQVALEYRAQAHLNALAVAYGFADWQHCFASVVNDEWTLFNWTVSHGTLGDFARQNGYPTMYAFRAAALASYEAPYAAVVAAMAAVDGQIAQMPAAQQQYQLTQSAMSAGGSGASV